MEERQSRKWEPIQGKLMTRWAKEVNPEDVLPEYPRPQMVREQWMNLNGLWEYAIRPIEEKPLEYDSHILVPFPVESSLSGVQKPLRPDQRLWYRRTFVVPEEWQGQRLRLHFGAVDWQTEVWVNQQPAGGHTGGYCPFALDITDFLNEGDNELIVIVWDPTETHGQERGKQTLKPQGLFYTAVSGIWQTVWVEPVPQHYINSFRIVPDIDQQELRIHIEANPTSTGGMTCEAAAYEKGIRIAYGQCRSGEILKLQMENPRLWSPEDPFLYDLTLQLVENGQPVDIVESYFGMRAFSIEQDPKGVKRLCLNHVPIFQHGILDQGYWPDGLYTAPTDEALAYDVILTKKLGFNMTRKHIKVEPARWYYHCDRMGLIVWQDMMNGGAGWNHLHHIILPNFFGAFKVKDDKYKTMGREDPANREQYRKELKEMVDTLYNVPSIGMWVPFNEAWGQFDAAETAAWLTEYDPSRPVDHASGWHDQEVGEIKSIHIYFRKLRMPNRIKNRTVVLSEYGGYSLLERGHVWQEGKEVGYKRCRSREELSGAYDKLIRLQLMPLISKGVCAAVYTQLTDVETELNGLVTYDREVVKIDPKWLKKLHQELFAQY
ncbi:glycoside hydrolase family 2 TIM barrel-domain containing protein [Paenibacillus dokdonensis]|uniref:Glycoside hydrolase family 2 TIM barrel-domain containing protein n=1 Tax=Paenibacillus dokdonensis TaxID=2567944 RepID=A0ABU6GWG7_9BACL|nr:sugar-binding domain-containing protein [Paenibacillus dokdonensis]MEC0244095.1 glycoside hydrolase family 2 TIM barrel-domain containing protein [Paenibacillus dokdonensis]